MVEAATNNGGDDRPSSLRRKKLQEADLKTGGIPTVSNMFPLDRYYVASEKVLSSFEDSFNNQRLDEAYVYGMRYCNFCVKEIVKHDYYRSAKFNSKRLDTNRRVTQVLTKLEKVAELMDDEEIKKEEQRKAILKRQAEERRRIQQQKLDELQRRVDQQKQGGRRQEQQQQQQQKQQQQQMMGSNVEESAFAKLQRLNGPLDPPPTPTAAAAAAAAIAPPSYSNNNNNNNKKVSFVLVDDQLEPDGHHVDASNLPPPLLPPSSLLDDDGPESNENSPPSYQDIVNYFGPASTISSNSNSSNRPAAPIIIQHDEPTAPSYNQVVAHHHQKKKQQQQQQLKPKRRNVSIRQYIANAERMYVKFQQERKIIVSALNTYQGRVNGSTNGCTVISACVVSKHLQNHGGVTDSHISSIIDRDCIPLLRTIRQKLDLTGSSLIIPSDVHDHMVDHKLLFQHKFVEVVGGNIVDPDHLGQLYELLQGVPGKTQHVKAAATLFFREHVISIVKFPISPTEAVYDMVDSMPTCNGRASRTRCMSLEALKVQLEWYSSHKFNDTNCTYIERNRWSDSMADFDPRVFQAFIWADLPQPKQ